MEQPSVNQEERGGANRYHWPLILLPLSPEGPALEKYGSGSESGRGIVYGVPLFPDPERWRLSQTVCVSIKMSFCSKNSAKL